MTTPDLTALRILVERVEQLDRAIYALKREGDLHADEIAVHAALPAAREALERVEENANLADAHRAYAEEASAHWKREAETGAMMLAMIHRGLWLDRVDGGISAQDVLDRVGLLAEEARQEERIIAAKESQMRYEDGYTCGANDERALWVKGEKK